MTELEFFPYHNRHIVFRLQNGDELSGVLFDPLESSIAGKPRTTYVFVPTTNLRAWKMAKQMNDLARIKELQKEIDILKITWAMRLNY